MRDSRLSFTDFVDLSGSDSFTLLTNDRIAELTGLGVDRVWKSTRVKERYILRERVEPADLCREVIRKLFNRLHIDGSDCNGLGLVHTEFSRERVQAMAQDLAREVGIERGKIIGFAYGCTGFVKLVEEAAPLADQIGEGEHFPLINVETLDRFIDANDNNATPIFASAATGTTLWKGAGHRLLHADVQDVTPPKNPNHEWAFRIEEADVNDFHGRKARRRIYRMNGKLAYENGIALIEEATRQSLDIVRRGVRHETGTVFVVPHNPNAKMIIALGDTVGKELDVTFVNGAEGMGNVSSCTIPSVLARLNSLGVAIKPGDVVLFPAAGISVRNPETQMSQGRGAMIW